MADKSLKKPFISLFVSLYSRFASPPRGGEHEFTIIQVAHRAFLIVSLFLHFRYPESITQP